MGVTAQDQQSRAELLPCPFCGGKPHVRPSQDADGCFWAWVQCSQCGARTQGDWASRRAETCPIFYEGVRDEWNQRALPATSSVSSAGSGEPPAAMEPVATIASIDEHGPCFGWHQHWANFPVGTDLFTATQVLAMGRVPACPFPCGWDGLHKIAVADGAYLARIKWPEDEDGVSLQRAAAMRTVTSLIDICRAMLAANQKAPIP